MALFHDTLAAGIHPCSGRQQDRLLLLFIYRRHVPAVDLYSQRGQKHHSATPHPLCTGCGYWSESCSASASWQRCPFYLANGTQHTEVITWPNPTKPIVDTQQFKNYLIIRTCTFIYIHIHIRLLPAALREAQLACILVTQGADFEVFAPQGRHVAPMGVKFGTEEGGDQRSPPCQVSPPSMQR